MFYRKWGAIFYPRDRFKYIDNQNGLVNTFYQKMTSKVIKEDGIF